jgi:hypothetical protein
VIAGVIDTGDKFLSGDNDIGEQIAGDNDTGEQLSPVSTSTTPAIRQSCQYQLAYTLK